MKDKSTFAFAGLYDIWKEKEHKNGKLVDKEGGKEIYSYTIITTEPHAIVGKIHDRMPVILQKEDEQKWPDPDQVEPKDLFPVLKQYPANEMEQWEVGSEARNPKNDYPEVIEPVKL